MPAEIPEFRNDDRNEKEHLEALRLLERAVDRLNHLLTGNGNPARGLIVRFALVEGQVKQFVFYSRLIAGGVISGVIGLVFYWAKH